MGPAAKRTEALSELLVAVETAESAIIGTMGRECEALRSGRLLAARAIRTRLADCARLYIAAVSAARNSLKLAQAEDSEVGAQLEKRRAAFAALLRVEMAALSAARQNAEHANRHAPPLARTA